MGRIRPLVTLAALVLGVASPRLADAACKQKGDKTLLEIRAKTALRRGPGLNYAPTSMIDDGKCVTFSEVSSDGQWVLIEDDKKNIGWIPTSALEASSIDRVGKKQPKTGPIGSGQERGFVSTKNASGLLARPEAGAEVKTTVPAGARLLALAKSGDGAWIEVRDDRGDTGWISARALKDEAAVLETVPTSDGGANALVRTTSNDAVGDRPGERPMVVPEDEDPTARLGPPIGEGLAIEAQLRMTGALPRHSLESNGAAAIRRYIVRAVAAGGTVEATAAPIGALRGRLSYSFLLLSGLAPPNEPEKTVSAQQHEALLVMGYPIQLGAVDLVPELGYSFSLFVMQPSLPNEATLQFISTHTHGASLGTTVAAWLDEMFAFEGEGALVIGKTIEYPFDLGGAGLTFGVRAGAGARVGVGGGAWIVAKYQLVHRSMPFSGISMNDPTITEATLTHTEHGFSVGLALGL
jgi:SH3-like domain-containing protein